MITFFTTPKPFIDHIATTQSNAIRSWRQLSSDAKIVIFGDAPGAEIIAQELNALHITNVKTNPLGTPYINDMFTKVEQLSPTQLYCYLNADIILPINFLDAAQKISRQFKHFLAVGTRSDLVWDKAIDFTDELCVAQFREFAQKNSLAHPVSGIDYFLYPRGTWKNIPDLLAGRAGFDNWLIWRARRSLIPVIDASALIFAIHQNHDYSHHPAGRDGVFEGEEAVHNRQYLGGNIYRGLNILDATHKFSNGKFTKKNDQAEVHRYRSRLSRVFPELTIPIRIINRIRSIFIH